MISENIIVAEDYDGVFVDDVKIGLRALLRSEGKANLPMRVMSFDVVKELEYQILKTKAFSRFVLGHLHTEMAPRIEALEIFNVAKGFNAKLVLLTSNSRIDLGAFEHEVAQQGIMVEAIYVGNPKDKGGVLDAMSRGRKLLFEDDPAVAQRAASYKNIEVGIVRENYNGMGSRLISANPRVHRMNDWNEAISLARNFAQSGTNSMQGQKQKSV